MTLPLQPSPIGHAPLVGARLAATLRLWGLPLAALVVGLCFAPSLPALWHQWWDSGTFNHCLIVIPAASWLVWDLERQGPASSGAPARWGLWLPHALVCGLAALWLLARLLSVSVVEQGALVAAVPTLAWAVNGHAWARRHRFALLFCLLATPVGEFLVPPLMELTATITVALVRLCGIPVLRDGMQLTMASGDFVVAEACSGIRYLIASVTLGLLFAHLTYRSLRRKLWFLLAAVLVPLLANGLRAWIIVMVAHFLDLQYATGVDHLLYGWVFFGVVIVALFYVGSWFQELGPSPQPVAAAAAALPLSAGDAVPAHELPGAALPPAVGAAVLVSGAPTATGRSQNTGSSARAVWFAVVLLGWAPVVHWAALQALAQVKGELPAYAFPAEFGGYAYAGSAVFPTPLEYAGADRVDVAAYQQGTERLYLAVVRYERDRPGHKFVSQTNRPYSWDWSRIGGGVAAFGSVAARFDDLRPKIRLEEGYDAVTESTSALGEAAVPTGEAGAAMAEAGPSPLGPWRVYSWYAAAGHTTTSGVKAKLLALLDWRTPRTAAPPPTVFLVAAPWVDAAAGAPAAAHAFGEVDITSASSR